MKAIIYEITNDVNSKVYIGQTWKTAQERFKRHCAEARWQNTKIMPIVFAIRKYGPSHFKINVLEELTDCTQSKLDEREVFWVQELKTFSPNGYNLKAGQSHGVWSEEIKKKIGDGNRGKKRNKETIERLRMSHKGHKVKDSTKHKLSIINTGKVLSEDHKQKIAESNTGQKRSNEAKEKMREKKLKFTYEVISPNGQLIKTQNLRQFCRDNDLNAGHMNSVACGKKAHYKHWRVSKN